VNERLAAPFVSSDLFPMDLELNVLRDVALRHTDGHQANTAIPRVAVHMGRVTTESFPGLCEPMLCLVLQGAKCVMIGDQLLRYGAASYFLTSVDVPTTGRIVEASSENPYVAVSLAFEPTLIADLLLDLPPVAPSPLTTGFSVSPVTAELVDAWLRLIRLLDRPADIAVLAPLFEREILYRLLQGPQGAMLRQIASADSRLSQIRRAIGWIRSNFDKPLRIESLATDANMSASSLHRHFKAVTAMSPLQYQKIIRLQQARRFLLANAGDAARAAFAVGYESASQFSREYARLFGAPPARDMARIRNGAGWQGDIRAVA
jgi:AraC-like DNA-binding protein